MNRKDAILVAVLLNAGLLIMLFAFSMHSEEKLKSQTTLTSPTVTAVALHQMQPVQVASAPQAEPVKFVEVPKHDFVMELQKTNEVEPKELPVAASIMKDPDYNHITEVVVKKGDVLGNIAKAYGCKVDEIVKLNQLSSTKLNINQVLKVPTNTLPAKTFKSSLVLEGDGKHYIVKPGDNPWTIAMKNQMKVEELLELNGLDAEKARHLKPGDKLRIK